VTDTLSISAVNGDRGFLGDLYVAPTHGSDSVILLNRPGRRDDQPFGYGDNGLQHVTFADGAGNRNIHQYRVDLTGTWQPHGRATDPKEVSVTVTRSRFLTAFVGDDASGLWTLFCADLSSDGFHLLTRWSLDFSAVPEPRRVGVVVAIACLGAGRLRRWR
jgi:hypothetical protein